MKLYAKTLFLALIGLSLVACKEEKIRISDGLIPLEYMPIAEKLIGKYEGEFDGVKNTLHFKIVDGYASLTSEKDLLGERCRSKIARLKSVQTKYRNGQWELKEVRFKFKKGRCRIAGKNLYLKVKPDGRVKAHLIDDGYWSDDWGRCNRSNFVESNFNEPKFIDSTTDDSFNRANLTGGDLTPDQLNDIISSMDRDIFDHDHDISRERWCQTWLSGQFKKVVK